MSKKLKKPISLKPSPKQLRQMILRRGVMFSFLAKKFGVAGSSYTNFLTGRITSARLYALTCKELGVKPLKELGL